MEITPIIGMLSDYPESVRQLLLQDGSLSVDMRTMKVVKLSNLPEPFLEITMPCGEHRVYKAKELPRKSARCSCGDPSHWFIKYERSHAQTRFNISNN